MAEQQTLTIVLKADGSGLTGTVRLSADEVRKLGDALEDTGNKGEKAGKQLKESAAASASEIGFAVKAWDAFGNAVGKVIGGVFDLVKMQIDAADSAGKLAARVNLSVESLSALQQAARSNSEELGAIPRLLEALQVSAVKAASGARSQAADFKAMGISVRDTATGALKPTETLLGEIAAKLNTYRDGTAKAALENRLFGAGASALRLTIKQLGEDGFDTLREKAAAAGRLISSDTAAQAAQFNDELQRAKDRVVGVASEIGQAMLPALARGAEGFADLVEAAAKNETVREIFSDLWEVIGKGAGIIHDVSSELFAFASDPTLLQFLESTRHELELINKITPDFIKNARPGAPLTVEWKAPDWLKEIAGENPGGALYGRVARQNTSDALESAANNPFNATSTQTLVEASKPLLDELGKMWGTVTGKVDEFGLHVGDQTQALAKALGGNDAPLPTLKKQADSSAASLDRLNQMLARDAQVVAQLRGEADATQKVYQDYVKQVIAANAAYQQEMALAQKVGASTETLSQIKANYTARIDAAQVALDRETDSLARSGDVLGTYMAKAKNDAALAAMTPRAQAVARAVDDITAAWKKAAAEGKPMKDTLEDVTKAVADNAAHTYDASVAAQAMRATYEQDNPYHAQIEAIEALQREIEKLKTAQDGVYDTAKIKAYTDEQERLNRQLAGMKLQDSASAIAAGLTSLQSLAEEGSEAYKAMQVAIDAANIAAAIGAIVNQGMGDPYTAFARIAAMAALMAKFVGDVGGGGGSAPSAHSAEARQAQQGTGTVLGDANAKSDSIAKATDITAKATTALVGINRGMLTALQALQQALGDASTLLARGSGDANFASSNAFMLNSSNGAAVGAAIGTAFMPVVGTLIGAALGAIVGKLLGGSSKVTDQGVLLSGGSLDDLGVSAYQTTESKTWRFGSTHTRDQLASVSDEFNQQFQLVVQSIVDTVRQAATALGISKEDIDARLAAFRVEEQKISLKGLSAEDQQKELQAVFSKLFDDIAGAVVPDIAQFQQVGEGLGETLVRVATEVQVAREAFKQLGIAVDESDPLKFAQISDALITAAGGIDAFTQGLSTFVGNFASDYQKFNVASDALNSAFAQVGLALPPTREAMWALMQTLDATTESGRAQIATLLRLADTASQYYDLLDAQAKAQSDYASFIADLNKEGAGLATVSPLRALVLQAEQWAQDSTKRAIELARAAGMQGASEKDLALIRQIESKKIAQAVQEILDQLKSTVDDFYDRGNALSDTASTSASAITHFGRAMTSAAEAAQQAAQLLLGELSPLNDQQKLQYALGAYDRGTIGADDVLQIGRRLYASSQAYTDLFNRVMATQRANADTRSPAIGNSASSNAAGAQETEEQRAARHRADAETILQGIASVVAVQGGSYEDVAKLADASLADLAKAMGFNNDQLKAYLDNIVAQDHAVPDSIDANTDRIVRALYDIAGRDAPSNLVVNNPVGVPGGGRVVDLPVDEPIAPTGGRPFEPPPPVSGGGASAGGGSEAGVLAALQSLRPLLESIVENASANTGELVTAISTGTQATRDVGDVLDRREQLLHAEDRR